MQPTAYPEPVEVGKPWEGGRADKPQRGERLPVNSFRRDILEGIPNSPPVFIDLRGQKIPKISPP